MPEGSRWAPHISLFCARSNMTAQQSAALSCSAPAARARRAPPPRTHLDARQRARMRYGAPASQPQGARLDALQQERGQALGRLQHAQTRPQRHIRRARGRRGALRRAAQHAAPRLPTMHAGNQRRPELCAAARAPRNMALLHAVPAR